MNSSSAEDDGDGPEPIEGEIVRGLFALVDNLKAHFDVVAAEVGLAPTQALALRHLDRPLPMGRLAEALGCESSNVTALVDRLQARGLVERLPDPGDRRVRFIGLTPAGFELRKVLGARLLEGVPAVAGLSLTERRTFRDLLQRVLAAGAPGRADAAESRTRSR